jgi:hypothetical protein
MNPNALLTQAHTPASVDVHRYACVVFVCVGILGVCLHPWQQVWWDDAAITQSS